MKSSKGSAHFFRGVLMLQSKEAPKQWNIKTMFPGKPDDQIAEKNTLNTLTGSPRNTPCPLSLSLVTTPMLDQFACSRLWPNCATWGSQNHKWRVTCPQGWSLNMLFFFVFFFLFFFFPTPLPRQCKGGLPVHRSGMPLSASEGDQDHLRSCWAPTYPQGTRR